MRWLVTALAVVAAPAAAQDTLLQSLDAHRHPVRLEAGRLTGAGAFSWTRSRPRTT